MILWFIGFNRRKRYWAMNLGGGGPYRYRLSGDTLTLTFGPGWQGETEITYRLVRLE